MFLLEDKKLNALAKNISILIKRNCKGFLSEIKPKQIVFKGFSVDTVPLFHEDITKNLFLIRNPADSYDNIVMPKNIIMGLDIIFELLHSSVRHGDLSVSGDNTKANKKGDVYVIFPLDDMEYIWSDLIKDSSKDYLKDPLPYEKYFVANDNKIKDLISTELDKATEKVSDALYKEIESLLRVEWIKYFENEARNYVARLPDNDMEHYASEDFIKTLAVKWFEKHTEEFRNTVQKRVDIEILADIHQKNINEIVDTNTDQIVDINFFKYNDFDEEEFVKLVAPSYHTNKLSTAIASEHEILFKCDKYYAIEFNFFDLYIKERLYR